MLFIFAFHLKIKIFAYYNGKLGASFWQQFVICHCQENLGSIEEIGCTILMSYLHTLLLPTQLVNFVIAITCKFFDKWWERIQIGEQWNGETITNF